jgi:mRNA interferase MazF
MKGKIVLVQFPFDDLSDLKVRPAYCLTHAIGDYKHVIFALITSRIPNEPLDTDVIIDLTHPDFDLSGLRQPSTLRLDHLVTLRQSMIRRELGLLSLATQYKIVEIIDRLIQP